MTLRTTGFFALLGIVAGCDVANGGSLGSGGSALSQRSTYKLSCTIDTPVDALVLEIPIELSYALDRPYTEGSSVELTFSATLTFGEEAATALIDAGFSKIDIISMRLAALIDGATPTEVATSLAAAPINDFDLDVDTDENGVAGPHRLALEAVTIETVASDGAREVALALALDQVSLQLGDVEVPADCLGPTLVGFSARFPVEPFG